MSGWSKGLDERTCMHCTLPIACCKQQAVKHQNLPLQTHSLPALVLNVHARLALQNSGRAGSGRAALHQLMGPQVNASRRCACSWYCRETYTAFRCGSLRVTYLQT